jgi:hypothetical protein
LEHPNDDDDAEGAEEDEGEVSGLRAGQVSCPVREHPGG